MHFFMWASMTLHVSYNREVHEQVFHRLFLRRTENVHFLKTYGTVNLRALKYQEQKHKICARKRINLCNDSFERHLCENQFLPFYYSFCDSVVAPGNFILTSWDTIVMQFGKMSLK